MILLEPSLFRLCSPAPLLLSDFDIGNSNVEFVPYWENTAIVPTVLGGGDPSVDDVVVSYYVNTVDNTYLVIVSNLTRYDALIEVDFGGIEVERISETYYGDPSQVPVDDNPSGVFTIEIARNDYKALRVNY